MSKPTRPKILPTESSIPLPPSEEAQQRLARAGRESRVRGECLEIAMEALGWYGRNCPVLLCGKAGEALAQIEQRLAQLEPEEEETG